MAICDESSTGLGRIGKENWAFKWQNHIPDLVIIGASLANGHAISAIATKKDLAGTVKHAWFNTFAAGHMQTKFGLEVLDIIKREKLDENAEKLGNYLLDGLKRVTANSKNVGSVSGKGLLLGIEIVENKQTNEPSKEKALKLLELTRERNLLFGYGGVHGNVLIVRPPLCITQ